MIYIEFPYPLEETGGSYNLILALDKFYQEFPYPLEVTGGSYECIKNYNHKGEIVSVPSRADWGFLPMN